MADHGISRVEYAPYSVTYMTVDDGERLAVDGAGVGLVDKEWMKDVHPFRCLCGEAFATEQDALDHLENPEAVAVSREVARHLRDVANWAVEEVDAGRLFYSDEAESQDEEVELIVRDALALDDVLSDEEGR